MEEAEDVPGSLRYALKEAKEYLGELVYLGGSADCLEDERWEEEGFLPFGVSAEAEEQEPFSEEGEAAEEENLEEENSEEENMEEYARWLAGSRNAPRKTLSRPTGTRWNVW